MKHFIISATILLLIISSCESKLFLAEKSISQIEKISLSEQTRGTNRFFTLSHGKLEASLNGTSRTNELSPSDWSIILNDVEKVNIEEISKLDVQSTKRYSDAALASIITITKNETEYQSPVFDSGNPPLELKKLYNEIQRIIDTKKSK